MTSSEYSISALACRPRVPALNPAPLIGPFLCPACGADLFNFRQTSPRPSGYRLGLPLQPIRGRTRKEGYAVTKHAELRAKAAGMRSMASLTRSTEPGLSLVEDRKMMQEHAQQLEADATGLEAQANAIDARS